MKVLQVCLNKSGDFEKVVRAFELKGHSSGVLGIDFSSDTSRAVTVSKDKTWRFYDVRGKFLLVNIFISGFKNLNSKNLNKQIIFLG